MNRQITFKKMQSGFTLVEIAIVLVIIGLLLGGVLKGTELIESAKVKRAVSEMNGVTAALYAYQDRYKRLPGDDGPLATLQQRGGSWTNITIAANASNGVLNATNAQAFNPGGESLGFWQHLKAAGFITGNANLTGVPALPVNAFGGVIGITADVNGVGGAPVLGGRVVCLSQVPGKSASAIDVQLDDGNGNTGKVRAIAGTPGVNTPPAATAGPVTYVEDTFYTLCQQI